MQRKFKVIMVITALLIFCTVISSASAAHVYNITDNSYSKYFNTSGYIKNTSIQSGDTLDLSGTIKNKNMYIDRPLNIASTKTANILNGTITILPGGSGTTVSNINIKNDDQKGIIIFESENNTIKNNNIRVNEDQESYAIYIYDSRNNKIVGNNLTNTGDYVTIGILLYASDNNEIRSNKVNTTGTDVLLPYLPSVILSQDIGAVKEIFPTYSILLLFSSQNNITDNDVVLKSGFSTPTAPSNKCMNSMVGVDIYYDSNNNIVNGNHIKVTGNNPFSYGLGVLGASWGTNNTSAKNNVFSGNTIDVTGSYFASGFIAGLNSFNTTLIKNTINVSADSSSYGVTLESSTGSNIFKNIITTTASVNYAVELFKSNDNHIEGNKIYPTGKYSMGIGTYNSGNNSILNNTITTTVDNSLQNPDEDVIHKDAIPAGNEGIKLFNNSNQNIIQYNIISSSAEYAINTTTSSHNTITNNYLISDNGKKLGDAAVTQSTDDTVNGNYLGSTIADFTMKNVGSAPRTMKFTDRSIGIITGWLWTFGDGNTSTLQNPTYTYKTHGNYTIKLTLTGPNGTYVKTVAITVHPDITAPVPKANIKGSLYKNSQAIKLTATDNQDTNPKIYYTLNGTTPTTKSALYKGPISISKTTTLKFIATDGDGNISPVKSETYTIDTVKPKITSTDPKNNAVKISPSKTIKVNFSEAIKKGKNFWIELKNSKGKAVSFTTSISGKVLTIKPKSKLAESLYTLIIHTGAVTDLAGNPVALKSAKFSVGTPPKITKIDPKNGATKVSTGKAIKMTFNEAIKKGKNFRVELKNSKGKAIAFKTGISGKVLTIKPTKKLAESKYKLTLYTGSITDIAGNPLAAKSTTFTTGTPPTVVKSNPKSNAKNIARTKTIKVTFNENIKKGSNYWIELKNSKGKKVTIKKSIKGKTLTITPTKTMTPNNKYKLVLHTSSITDIAGNPIILKTISFTTRRT